MHAAWKLNEWDFKYLACVIHPAEFRGFVSSPAECYYIVVCEFTVFDFTVS